MVKLRGIHRVGSYNYHEIPYSRGMIYMALLNGGQQSHTFCRNLSDEAIQFLGDLKPSEKPIVSWPNSLSRSEKDPSLSGKATTFIHELAFAELVMLLAMIASIWGFHGVSMNGGTPKWMVYDGKSH